MDSSLGPIRYMAFRILGNFPERLVVFMEGQIRHYALGQKPGIMPDRDDANAPLYEASFDHSDDVICSSRDGRLFVVEMDFGARIINFYGRTVQELHMRDPFFQRAYFEPDRYATHLYFVYRRRHSERRKDVAVYRRGRDGRYRFLKRMQDIMNFLYISIPANRIVKQIESDNPRSVAQVRLSIYKIDKSMPLRRSGAAVLHRHRLWSMDSGLVLWQENLAPKNSVSIPVGFSRDCVCPETWQIFITNRQFRFTETPVCIFDVAAYGEVEKQFNLLTSADPTNTAIAGSFVAIASADRPLSNENRLSLWDISTSYVPRWIAKNSLLTIDPELIKSYSFGSFVIVDGNKIGRVTSDSVLTSIELDVSTNTQRDGGTIRDFAFVDVPAECIAPGAAGTSRILFLAFERRLTAKQHHGAGTLPPVWTSLMAFRCPNGSTGGYELIFKKEGVPFATRYLVALEAEILIVAEGRMDHRRHIVCYSFRRSGQLKLIRSLESLVNGTRYVHIRPGYCGKIYGHFGPLRVCGRLENDRFVEEERFTLGGEYKYYARNRHCEIEVLAKSDPTNIILILRNHKRIAKLSPWGLGASVMLQQNGSITAITISASGRYVLIAFGHHKKPKVIVYELATGIITTVYLEDSWSDAEYISLEPVRHPVCIIGGKRSDERGAAQQPEGLGTDDLFYVGRFPNSSNTTLNVYSIRYTRKVAQFKFSIGKPGRTRYQPVSNINLLERST